MEGGELVKRVAEGGPLDGFDVVTLKDDEGKVLAIRLPNGTYRYRVDGAKLVFVGVGEGEGATDG